MLSFDSYCNSVHRSIDNPGVRRVFAHLTSPESVAAMCLVSEFGLPAISAVAQALEKRFRDDVDFPMESIGNRQQVGRMIRYILSKFGYEQDLGIAGNVRIKECFGATLFRAGPIYRKTEPGQYHIQHSIEERGEAES